MSSVQRHFFSLLEFISYSPVIKNRRIHTLPEHSCTAFNRTQRKTYHIIIIITFSSSVPSDIKAKPVGFISDTSDIKHWSQNTHNKCVYSSVCVCVYSFYITINDSGCLFLLTEDRPLLDQRGNWHTSVHPTPKSRTIKHPFKDL